jgi:hypothetical protein
MRNTMKQIWSNVLGSGSKRRFLVLGLVALNFISRAQQKVDVNYINDQVSKVTEYTLLTLLRSDNTAPKDSLEKWQMGHLKNLFQLHLDKKISIFGPIGNDPSLTGIIIFNTADTLLIRKQLQGDPFIHNHILSYKLYKWYGIPDQRLMPLAEIKK